MRKAALRLVRRIARWSRFRTYDAELQEELAFHRAALERDLVARGYSPAAARKAARRVMGNEVYMREEARSVWLWPALEAVWKDAFTSIRGLRQSPAFTLGILLTFALGLGANVAMFSVLDRLMFRPPPLLRDPASVHRVYLYRTVRGVEDQTGGQYARYADLTRWTRSFSSVGGHSIRTLAVGVGADARELRVAVVTANFFGFFDAPPVAGRYFTEVEDRPPAGAAVAVLSHAFWQTQYGGRRAVLGSTLQIGSVVYTIIGIAPKGFAGLWSARPPVAFIPVASYSASESGPNWESNYGTAIGLGTIVRRKPGVNTTTANADLTNALTLSYRAQWQPSDSSARALDERIASLRPRAIAGSILPERGPARSNMAKVATWVAGVTSIVLLIACANVANLLLARAFTKRREIALKLALGVSRPRLLSQFLTETMLLAVGGAALALVVGAWLSAVLTGAFLPGAERPPVVTDPRTLVFLAIVTVVVGLFATVLPMLQVRRLSLTDDLKSDARAGTYHRSRTRAVLLVLEAALSLVLLVGAGLFVRSLHNVRAVRLGFDADSVLVVAPQLRGVALDSADIVALRQRLLAAATTVPGITHASLRFAVPFAGMASWPIYVASIDSVRQFGRFDLNGVSPDYFRTMGTRLLRGRGIQPGDIAGAPRVMVVGASMAKVLWPGQDPIGKCVRIAEPANPCTQVVGVAEDIHTESIGPEERLFYYYVPAAHFPRPHDEDGGLFARVRGDAVNFIEPLRQRLQKEMPGTSYVSVIRLGEIVEGEKRAWATGASLFTAFGALALVLAGVGLYSMIAYNVAQRRKELAIRTALGAVAADQLRLVVADGLRFAGSGVLVGGLIALVAGRWIEPLLFNQSPRDPAVFGFVTALLLLVAIAASAIPAVRAARVDPNAALRGE
jgi:predicted permease